MYISVFLALSHSFITCLVYIEQASSLVCPPSTSFSMYPSLSFSLALLSLSLSRSLKHATSTPFFIESLASYMQASSVAHDGSLSLSVSAFDYSFISLSLYSFCLSLYVALFCLSLPLSISSYLSSLSLLMCLSVSKCGMVFKL